MADQAHPDRGRRPLIYWWGASATVVLVLLVILMLMGDFSSPGPSTAQDRTAARPAVPVVEHLPTHAGAQPTPATPIPAARPLIPERLRIPVLDVDAEVLPIQVVESALTPPSDATRIGWWSDGARPGDAEGTAVLTGHTVHTGGGALDHLDSLDRGDVVIVHGGPREVSYTVSSMEIISREDVARRSAELFRQDGPGRLMIITCEDWNGVTYDSSVIVVATPTTQPD